MKRYLFTMLIVACAGGCSHNSKPSETANNTPDDSHIYAENQNTYSSTDSTLPSDDGTTAMTAPEHRTSDEIASTGTGVPDRTRPVTPSTNTPSDATTTTGMTNDTAQNPSVVRSPDNTAVNKRDRNDATLTPMDQGESDADVKMTQEIRRAVMDSDQLSFSAKNVKIITRNGKVTLRGTVPSARERTTIQDAAKARAGANAVDNQIEVSNK